MKKNKQMNLLIETFFNTESGPVLSLNIAQGLIRNDVCVCAIISEEIENLNDWKKTFKPDCLYIWKRYNNKYLENLLNDLKIKIKYFKRRFSYALYPNPVNRNLLIGRFIKHDENIMILHDVIPHSGTNDDVNRRHKELIMKADNIMVLSKKFIPIVEIDYHIPQGNIFYMRHGLMKYPTFEGEFNKVDLESKINFLYFGRIEKYKGLHVLADAYREIEKKYSDVTLTVAGSGDFAEYVEEYKSLKSATVMNKYITDEEIAYLFSKPNTVVVLPYIDATQSGVIGMAYNYGTPIIVSDTGGMKEQLFDGEVGVFAQPGDAKDLEEKMKNFITNPDLFNEQKRLVAESKEKMTWEYICKELLMQLEEHKNRNNNSLEK